MGSTLDQSLKGRGGALWSGSSGSSVWLLSLGRRAGEKRENYGVPQKTSSAMDQSPKARGGAACRSHSNSERSRPGEAGPRRRRTALSDNRWRGRAGLYASALCGAEAPEAEGVAWREAVIG